MTKKIDKSEWYQALCEDLEATITEKRFTCAWSLLEMYHEVGERIHQDSNKEQITQLVKMVSRDLHLCERNVWYACQFYQKFPDINALPEGKAMSWTKVKKLLPENSILDQKKEKIMQDVAESIFKKYGLEQCIEIVEIINKLIKESTD